MKRFYVRKHHKNYYGIYRGSCQICFAKSKAGAYNRNAKLKNSIEKLRNILEIKKDEEGLTLHI